MAARPRGGMASALKATGLRPPPAEPPPLPLAPPEPPPLPNRFEGVFEKPLPPGSGEAQITLDDAAVPGAAPLADVTPLSLSACMSSYRPSYCGRGLRGLRPAPAREEEAAIVRVTPDAVAPVVGTVASLGLSRGVRGLLLGGRRIAEAERGLARGLG